MRINYFSECLKTATNQSIEVGYIDMTWQQNYWWVDKFVIHPKYRRMGHGKAMARSLLPAKCRLIACPLPGSDKEITTELLVKFYESVGFKLNVNSCGEMVMEKGSPFLLNTICQDCQKECENWKINLDETEIECYCDTCKTTTFHPYQKQEKQMSKMFSNGRYLGV